MIKAVVKSGKTGVCFLGLQAGDKKNNLIDKLTFKINLCRLESKLEAEWVVFFFHSSKLSVQREVYIFIFLIYYFMRLKTYNEQIVVCLFFFR